MEQINQVLGSILSPLLDEKPSVIKSSFTITLLIILVKVSMELYGYLIHLSRMIVGVFKPLNYELDMTTSVYCKHLAEVNNNLRIQTKRERVTQINSNEQSGADALDCVTNPLASTRDAFTEISEMNYHNSSLASRTCDSRGNSDGQNSGSSDHVYPNGWLPVMESFKVKEGEIKRAILMGRDLIVTRSSEGRVNVLDAYCPHMGVHIGVGGRVRRVNNESCVQCPFHGWTFRASDGQCVSIPYQKNASKYSIPKQAQLGTWQSCEVDNFIYVWYHVDGQPPSWHLESSPELASSKYVLAGRSCHTTNLEIRDMHENGADMNHFEGIHNDLFVFGGEFIKVQAYNHLQKYVRHHWSPDWRPVLSDDGKTTHMAELNLDSWISLFKLRLFDIRVRATQIGPACVRLRYNSHWYGKGLLEMNAVPLGGRRTLYVQHIYTEPSMLNWVMAKFVLMGEIMQLERDLFIWNHKKNITGPVFVSEDKIIKRFRLWYSQFYKRKSKITIRDSEQKTDGIVDNNKQKPSLEF